jgi:hypothetical protein
MIKRSTDSDIHLKNGIKTSEYTIEILQVKDLVVKIIKEYNVNFVIANTRWFGYILIDKYSNYSFEGNNRDEIVFKIRTVLTELVDASSEILAKYGATTHCAKTIQNSWPKKGL